MKFDYSKLCGKIVEICGSQKQFAKVMNLSERTLSLKLNNKRFWKQTEIIKASEILKISLQDIPIYFFKIKVQNF